MNNGWLLQTGVQYDFIFPTGGYTINHVSNNFNLHNLRRDWNYIILSYKNCTYFKCIANMCPKNKNKKAGISWIILYTDYIYIYIKVYKAHPAQLKRISTLFTSAASAFTSS